MPPLEQTAREGICRRLVVLFDLLGLSDTQLAAELHYKNSTTICKSRRGECVPSPERLSLLARLTIDHGLSPDLHWILTGNGPAFRCGNPALNDEIRSLTNAANAWVKEVSFERATRSEVHAMRVLERNIYARIESMRLAAWSAGQDAQVDQAREILAKDPRNANILDGVSGRHG